MTSHLLLELINLLANAFLVGLIWIIQCVHYPSFYFIERHAPAFHSFHVRSISIIVAPLMTIELFSSILLFYLNQDVLFGALILLLAIIWLSTFFIQMPIHEKLKREWNKKQVDYLIQSNWIRTILWSIKLVILAWVFYVTSN